MTLGILKFRNAGQVQPQGQPQGQTEPKPTELKAQSSSPGTERQFSLLDVINVWLGAKKLPPVKDEDSLIDLLNRGMASVSDKAKELGAGQQEADKAKSEGMVE